MSVKLRNGLRRSNKENTPLIQNNKKGEGSHSTGKQYQVVKKKQEEIQGRYLLSDLPNELIQHIIVQSGNPWTFLGIDRHLEGVRRDPSTFTLFLNELSGKWKIPKAVLKLGLTLGRSSRLLKNETDLLDFRAMQLHCAAQQKIDSPKKSYLSELQGQIKEKIEQLDERERIQALIDSLQQSDALTTVLILSLVEQIKLADLNDILTALLSCKNPPIAKETIEKLFPLALELPKESTAGDLSRSDIFGKFVLLFIRHDLIDQALKAAAEISDSDVEAEAFQNISQALAEKEDQNQAIEIAEKIQDPTKKFQAFFQISKTLAKRGQVNPAREVAERILDPKIKSQALYQISKALSSRGKMREAARVAYEITEGEPKLLAFKRIFGNYFTLTLGMLSCREATL